MSLGLTLLDWISEGVRKVTKMIPEIAESLIPNHKVTMQIILVIVVGGVIYIMTYHKRKVCRHLAIHDEKVSVMKERYKSLITRETLLLNLNYGKDKNVPIGAVSSRVDIQALKKSIKMIEEAIEKDLGFSADLSKHIEPFVMEATGGTPLDPAMELEDALELLQVFEAFLEDKEPIRAKRITEGDPRYNIIVTENEILKEQNEQLANVIKECEESEAEKTVLLENLTTTYKQLRESKKKIALNQKKLNRIQKEIIESKKQRMETKAKSSQESITNTSLTSSVDLSEDQEQTSIEERFDTSAPSSSLSEDHDQTSTEKFIDCSGPSSSVDLSEEQEQTSSEELSDDTAKPSPFSLNKSIAQPTIEEISDSSSVDFSVDQEQTSTEELCEYTAQPYPLSLNKSIAQPSTDEISDSSSVDLSEEQEQTSSEELCLNKSTALSTIEEISESSSVDFSVDQEQTSREELCGYTPQPYPLSLNKSIAQPTTDEISDDKIQSSYIGSGDVNPQVQNSNLVQLHHGCSCCLCCYPGPDEDSDFD